MTVEYTGAGLTGTMAVTKPARHPEEPAPDDLLAAEDGKVVTRFTTRATHTGEVFGVSPSNRSLTFTGIEIYSVLDGKVTDWWIEINMDELFNPSAVTGV